MKRSHALYIVALAVLVAILPGCCQQNDHDGTDTNASVPKGDPPFTALTDSWVLDNAGVMETGAIAEAGRICQGLQDDGIAEVVVLIQNGIKHPSDYATHYGRWLRLGKKGLSTAGGNNGVVWLIRPDADEKMTYSIGRGLPRLTSSHMVDIMNAAKEYLNFGNYDTGVLEIVRRTDEQLRHLYSKKGAGQ
ncbi:MAG: TPM domain-containing protein [Verrucomicrobia bacterium]|nr:TPM domain-containing protein [Verrucomicrobiota bacterium]